MRSCETFAFLFFLQYTARSMAEVVHELPITLTPEAEKKLRSLGVAALYLFGSRAKGVSGPMSDFDFGVVLNDPRRVRNDETDIYEKLYDIVHPLCHPKTLDADIIDLVFLDSPRVPLELKFHIVRHGSAIFDANPRRRADAEERIMEAYCDFRPVLDVFDHAVLARI